MFRRASLLLAIGAGTILAMGCSTPLDTFECQTSADCQSAEQPGGQCEPTRLCSFTDLSCEQEGRRYGEGSGELSNQCVGQEDTGTPDGATVGPTIDAGTTPPPVDSAPMDIDASPANIDAAPSGCVNINLTVHDDNSANDKLKIRVDNVDIHICQGDAVAPGADTVENCTFCVDLGTDVKLSWYEGFERITAFTSDCQSPCPFGNGEFSCDFTVTEACSATAAFDVDFPAPAR